MSSESLPSDTRVDEHDGCYLWGKKTHLSYHYYMYPTTKRYEVDMWTGKSAHSKMSDTNIGLKIGDCIIVSVDMDKHHVYFYHKRNSITIFSHSIKGMDNKIPFHFAVVLSKKAVVCVSS